MGATILQRIAAGDEGAVKDCLDEYGGVVWSLAERYMKPLGGDVEDAVQEIMVEVWRSAGRYDPAIGSEPSFVATIAHRRLIDRQRRAAARPFAPVRELENVQKPATPVKTDGVADEVKRAGAAFQKLDDVEREALWYSLYYGMSHERIAAATGTPLGTIKTRIRRGLTRLRELLGAGGTSDPEVEPKVSGGVTR